MCISSVNINNVKHSRNQNVTMMLFYIIIIIAVCVFYIYLNLGRKHKVPQGLKRVPTEQGVPVLGVVNQIGHSLCNYLLKLSNKHGPICGIKFGMRDFVVLNTFEYIKAALVDNGNTFSGRCKGLNYAIGVKDSGLIFIDGSVWAEQRSFVLKSLKDFGIGRSKSVEVIQDECTHLLENLESLKGKSINMFKVMSTCSINVICKFSLNKRFSQEEPELVIFEKYMTTVATEQDWISDLLLMFPFIERHETLMKLILWVTSRKSLLDDCHDMFRNLIKERSRNLDLNSEGNDLTDMFLINQNRLQKSSGNFGSFTEIQLVRNIFELMGTGYDLAATVVWGFLFMALYPEVQNQVHEEIIKEIGNDRLITAADKPSLTYTQAVMDEILRLGSPDPHAIFHRTLNDVSVKGYHIPKDILVIPNLFACHLNPKTWEHPFEFHPEHFLVRDDNGELKYKPREELITFGLGKRRCIGESLGRMAYFIFLTSIVRRFRVIPAVTNVTFDVLDANDGIIRTPKLQDFIFESRQ